MKLPLLPQNKANHVIYGAVVSCAFVAATLTLGVLPVGWVPLATLASAAAVGALKEYMDHRANKQADRELMVRPHTVDPTDVAWTAVGGAPAAFLTWRVLVTLGF